MITLEDISGVKAISTVKARDETKVEELPYAQKVLKNENRQRQI